MSRCFICDEESSIRHFLSLILQGAGVDAEEFSNEARLRASCDGAAVDLIVIDVPLDASMTAATIEALGKSGFRGAVQLMSSRGTAVMEQVRQVGERNGIRMLPALKKPFDAAAVQAIVKGLKIGLPPSVAARIRLDEALANNWVEFWHQPKIDLRRKQLAGVEAFARVRHPQHGVLTPEAFMPGAQASEITALAERAVADAIRAERTFAALGLSLPLTINLDAATLAALPVADLVRGACRDAGTDFGAWPGLIVDIPEVQIVNDLPLASVLHEKLLPFKIRLALDDAGRGLAKLGEAAAAPFAEFKLDGQFVIGCADDKINNPICRQTIDLAKRFGGVATANGIAKAADLTALSAMGYMHGQGLLLGQPMAPERFLSLLRQRGGHQTAKAAA